MFERILNKNNSINEWSYKRFARFYDIIEFKDEQFMAKLALIEYLINDKKCEDINYIAKEANCTYIECIAKIKYLKNKRIIGDYYVDTINGIVKKCSVEDQKLIDIYKVYIYNKHSSLEEIVNAMPQTNHNTKDIVRAKVIKDLKYLINKNLLNGVIFNEVDEVLIYYSVEKKKLAKYLLTLSCPNCGALNDVARGSKVKCPYCGTIVIAPDEEIVT